MNGLDEVVRAAQKALPDRVVRPYGWRSPDGAITILVCDVPGPPGLQNLVRVDVGGAVVGSIPKFIADIQSMSPVGVWPADDDTVALP